MKLKKLVRKMENSISEYFDRENLDDPTKNFNWEYILIDKKRYVMHGVCQVVR